MDIENIIKEYVAKDLLFSDNGFEYSNDDSFLEEGIIDSTGVLELVLFVEEEFGIAVEDQDVTRENFDSINELANYIRQRLTVSHPQSNWSF